MKTEKFPLYKYCPINDGTLQRLENNTLHFNCPNKYNDPFDCRLNIFIDGSDEAWELHRQRLGFSKEEIAFYKSIWTVNKDNSGKFHREIQQKALSTTRITCFSEIPNNILMWSHYADSHKGLCLIFEADMLNTLKFIEFDKSHMNYENPVLPANYAGLMKVRYSNHLPSAYDHLDHDQNKLAPFLITKAVDWTYEAEWRIILPESSLKTEDPRYIRKHLIGIIFGMCCSFENIKTINDIIKGYGIQTFYANPTENEYSLEIDTIKKYA